MPHPALPAPPPLRRSPLFWGGLFLTVFLLFAWVMSWRHLARASRYPASICSWQSAVSLTRREVHPGPFVSRWVFVDPHPGPSASRWAWEFLQPPAGDVSPSLFPPPRRSVSYIYWDGRQFVSGTQERYHFLDRSLTLPYWLLLAIVIPLWLLALSLSHRRFRRGAAALPPA